MLRVALTLALFTLAPAPRAGDPAKLAAEYVRAVKELNDAHAAKPVAKSEEELAKKLPKRAVEAFEELVSIKNHAALADALLSAGEAALDLDRTSEFEAARERLSALSPEHARKLGIVLSRTRFVARGLDGVEKEGLEQLAEAFERVLDGYNELFGLTNFSKVRGKKLRLRAHLVEQITRPPHFAPELPWHSEIDFPVIDARAFSSPTKAGQFLFYGLCHELGHVLAMWGDTHNEEDHHSWAHYTGIAVVEHLSRTRADDAALANARDVRWRSLEIARRELKEMHIAPGTKDADGVLALLLALHDSVGSKALGAALNALDSADKCQRVNRVRYYHLADLEQALLLTPEGKQQSKAVRDAFDGR